MIGGQGAVDRFIGDMEREAAATPAQRWLRQNAAEISRAHREMQAENAGRDAEDEGRNCDVYARFNP